MKPSNERGRVFKLTTYVRGDLCARTPEIEIYNGWTQEQFKVGVYVDDSYVFRDAYGKIADTISKECGSLPQYALINGVYKSNRKYQAFPNARESSIVHSEITYTGKLLLGTAGYPEIIDDDPTQRPKYLKAEEMRIYNEELAYRIRRHKREQFWKGVTAIGVGYLQGLSYEFGDEGFCSALTSDALSGFTGLEPENYAGCHNFLNDLLDEVRSDQGMFFAIGNLAGIIQTTPDLCNPDDTKTSRATCRAVSACAESVLQEHGKMRIGQTPTQKVLRESCAFGAAVEGGVSLIRR